MRKNYLLTPGPTPLPPQVCEAMSRPIIHHRTPQFQAVLKEATEGLKYVFQTKNDVFILASSGTGAMEASVINLLSPGDTALTIQGGKFGERWTEICKAYGINTQILDVEWGKAVEPKEIEKKLKSNPQIKAVFTTLCETSTGVATDIEGIGKILKDSGACLGLAYGPAKAGHGGNAAVSRYSDRERDLPRRAEGGGARGPAGNAHP